jgi:CYTH domain-containing protein
MITTPDGRPDKYAQIERERRYLLSALPEALAGSDDFVRIIDRYLPDSSLRLRRIETPDRQAVSLKLARKESRTDLTPEETIITNLYLTDAEYELLARLPAAILQKRRYTLVYDEIRFSIDQFEGGLDGLVLAEMHLLPGMKTVAGCPLPDCVRDVTAEPAFTGGQMVQLSPEEARAWVGTILARQQEDET